MEVYQIILSIVLLRECVTGRRRRCESDTAVLCDCGCGKHMPRQVKEKRRKLLDKHKVFIFYLVCCVSLCCHDDDFFFFPNVCLGDSGVWGLKKNFALLELLERLQNGASNQSGMAEDTLKGMGEVRTPDWKFSVSPSVCFSVFIGLPCFIQCIIRCDEDESHTASMYCTVCATHLCAECSQLTHSTRTLAKHRQVPLADKPHEKTLCPQHQVHAIEFVCLEEACQSGPLMCCVCKEYGKHQGHKVQYFIWSWLLGNVLVNIQAKLSQCLYLKYIILYYVCLGFPTPGPLTSTSPCVSTTK